MADNIIEGIQERSNRLRGILPGYDRLPDGTGLFGATMIRRAIGEGEEAIASGDLVRMVRAYKELMEFKL